MYLGAAGMVTLDCLKYTPEILRKVSEIGFTVHNVLVSNPETISESDISKIKQSFAKSDLKIGQTNGRYGGGLVSEDESERKNAIKFVKRMCNLTAKLGSSNTYLRPGSINQSGAWLPHQENHSDKTFDRLVDSTKQICLVAQNEGVKISIEGGIVSPLHSAKKVKDFIDAVGSKTLGFNFDPVNFISSLDEAYDTKKFMSVFFELLEDKIIGVHMKDFKIIESLLIHFEETEIGTGLIDHSYYLEMMEKVCPQGDILIEHIPSDKFKPAYERVNKYSEKLQINWQSYKS